jgi:hypothetical protein
MSSCRTIVWLHLNFSQEDFVMDNVEPFGLARAKELSQDELLQVAGGPYTPDRTLAEYTWGGVVEHDYVWD